MLTERSAERPWWPIEAGALRGARRRRLRVEAGALLWGARSRRPLCRDLLQDEERKQQARDLFEESAHQGCLASSYLLWERDRRTDVSGPGSGERRICVGQRCGLQMGPRARFCPHRGPLGSSQSTRSRRPAAAPVAAPATTAIWEIRGWEGDQAVDPLGVSGGTFRNRRLVLSFFGDTTV